MKWILASLVVCTVLLTGCNRGEEARIAELKAQASALEQEKSQLEQRNETLQDQLTESDGKRADAEGEANALRVQLGRASGSADEIIQLHQRIKELEAEVERLKQPSAGPHPQPQPAPQPQSEPLPQPEPQPRDMEVVKQVEELLPLVKSGDDDSLNKALGLIEKSDKQTRDDFIASVQQWVKDEPENKKARLALAAALGHRFQDLKDPMKMGMLAGQMKTEAEAALKIDPEYYDAVHFLCILRVNYPTFTAEFKEANVSFDKALSMHENMTWEDRFCEIYAAYGMWYRKLEKYDDALAWVQKGLDKNPRDAGLLNEQAAIEAAKAAPEEE